MLLERKFDENQSRFFEDKRNFRRMLIDCRVTFSELGSEQEFIGRSRDLSGAGIMFETAESVPVGMELQLKVLPETDTIAPLEAAAEVVRVEPLDGGAWYKVACLFKNVGD